MYTKMTNEETHTQQVVDWRTGAISSREVTGEDNSVAIPRRKLNIDMAEVARIREENDAFKAKIQADAKAFRNRNK